jgi:hypothetical protein
VRSLEFGAFSLPLPPHRYFETFVTAIAHHYAANNCFRKQQAMKMVSHLPMK